MVNHAFLCICYCVPEKEILPQRLLGAVGTKGASASVSVVAQSCGSCVAGRHCSSSSSTSNWKPPPPAASSVSWSFPSRGQAEGKWFPAASFIKRNCVRVRPGFPLSLRNEHIQLPRKRQGGRETQGKGNFHLFPWLGSTWLRAATRLVGGD